jgi:hypothetical protein
MYNRLIESVAISHSNPMLEMAKKCMKSKLLDMDTTKFYCTDEIMEAYHECNSVVKPIMSEVARVKDMIEEKYFS